MAETLLIGVDGSKCCNRAVKCAAERAKASGARLIVAFVIEWSRYTFNTPEENEERHKRREQEIEVARTRILDPLVDSLKADGLNVEGVVGTWPCRGSVVRIGQRVRRQPDLHRANRSVEDKNAAVRQRGRQPRADLAGPRHRRPLILLQTRRAWR